MKLLVLSDLHVESSAFRPISAASVEADVVILAGDIHGAYEAVDWIAQAFPDKPVIYVAGNHEFYGNHWEMTLRILRTEASQKGVLFLENDEVVIGDVRFLGCTLWTDFCTFGSGERQVRAMRDYRIGLNDCRYITAGVGHDGVGPTGRRLTPEEVLERHVVSRSWLADKLSNRSSRRTVVVTHHLPTAQSVPERYVDHWLTPGYASKLPRSLVTAADLWVHGHTHDSCDYEVSGPAGSVRVVCNPRGYQTWSGFENPVFNSKLLVEI